MYIVKAIHTKNFILTLPNTSKLIDKNIFIPKQCKTCFSLLLKNRFKKEEIYLKEKNEWNRAKSALVVNVCMKIVNQKGIFDMFGN